jgi:K+ transporter
MVLGDIATSPRYAPLEILISHHPLTVDSKIKIGPLGRGQIKAQSLIRTHC